MDTATAAPLESLPPPMQDEILSRLPVRDAARTSALSCAWRRRWETVPYRFLDWPLRVPADTIDHVLAHSTYPVRKFRHRHVPESDFNRFDLWLLRLAALGVRSISVEFDVFSSNEFDVYRRDSHMLHSCIFSCGELATLDLVGCDIPAPPPCFVGLPSLTTLILSKVGFPHGVRGLESLISFSPSLRNLQLEELRIPAAQLDGRGEFEQWFINAPNLQRLSVHEWYGWYFTGLPFLEVADISGVRTYRADDFLDLISWLDQARELKLTMPFISDADLKGLSPSFENLKNLSLQTQFHFQSNILNILRVVRNAPKLEVLEIELPQCPNTIVEGGGHFLYAQRRDDLFSNLTIFRIKNVICKRYEMLFIELVLSKARRLEAFDMCLSIHCSRSVDDALAEVAQYGRASPGANVIIRHQQNAT